MTYKHINTLKKIFAKSDIGQITIHTPEDKELVFKGANPGPVCDLRIKDWKMMDMLAKRGDVGLGEAYQLGMWESSHSSDFLSYCGLNLDNMGDSHDANFVNRMIFYFYNQFIRLNTKYGSKKNILAHYDIGNDFYGLWIDPTMTYSSAIRNSEGDDLQQSQLNKYNRIIHNLDLQNKKVLEIGCGWGGFADQAYKKGAEVTAITISDKQYDFTKNRLGNNANILKQDYRDISGKFDNIVSIEMFEAVGEKYWPSYFDQIKKSLVKNGRAMIQTITIRNDLFSQYRKKSDYIRHYVFPGGMLPSSSVFCNEAKKAGLGIGEIFEFGNDYAWTLSQWEKNFNSRKGELIEMGYDASFLRSWSFYFGLSIAGFVSGRTNVMQIELTN